MNKVSKSVSGTIRAPADSESTVRGERFGDEMGQGGGRLLRQTTKYLR